MLNQLKKQVLEANQKLYLQKLVVSTWGNVSWIDRSKNLIVIKPSWVPYDHLQIKDMVVVDFEGKIIEGKLKPSVDILTHIELYKAFPKIGGVAHTHSTYAVAWSQAWKNIPIMGTTHADSFFWPIRCTRTLSQKEIQEYYEIAIARSIIEVCSNSHLSYEDISAVLVKSHGPFVWSNSPIEAFQRALCLEEIAKMAFLTYKLWTKPPSKFLVSKHFERKNWVKKYYGQ